MLEGESFKVVKIKILFFLNISLIACFPSLVAADVGALIWEDNFDSLNANVWNIDVGDGCDQGLCGWGNQELQWYAENNVFIQNIVGETGNKGLVLEARNETINGKVFTSGKIQSNHKLAVQYGMIEIRVKMSDVDTGLWPALWMLGTGTANWPAKGEIDMMEMGQSSAARAEAGFPNAPANNYAGSNLIFYADAACSDGNPSCAASVAYQNDNAHLSQTPLTNRFVTYRTYWTDAEIRFTIEDNGVEYDMFDAPFTISEESNEFQAPFYLLLNLAVGGLFTDATTNAGVTAPLPGKMIVDYIRIYELDGQGEVFAGNLTQPETGTFGVFTDTTLTSATLEPGISSDIYVWNQNSVSEGNIAPFEGDNVIAWHYTPNEWFGGGIQTRQARDMSNFVDGNMTFKIKIPANVSFKIGVADTYTNENWLTFPANTTTYGLVRNGDWGQVTIPVADLAGNLIALQSIKNHFNIVSVAGAEPDFSFDFAIDDIVWTGGGDAVFTDSDGDGIDDSIDQCPNTPSGTNVDAIGCEVVDEIDFTDLVGTVSAQYDDSPAAEVMINAFDNSVDTKYLTFHASGWLQFKISDAAYVANKYRLTSANDASERDPLNWNLQGSSDGSNWITIDSRTNEDFTEYKQTREFVFNNSTAYQYYRLNMSNNSGTLLQIAEVEILGPSTPTSIDVDSDGDGVLDSIDQCSNTPGGTAVDNVGCALPLDSDNDGVNDSTDQCANTPAGTTVDAVGCPLVVGAEGVEQTSDSAVSFYVNTTGWADVHYTINGGGQQNLRMEVIGGRNELSVTGLSSGDVISYWFTYLQANGSVVDTTAQTHLMSGDGSNSNGPTGYILCASENGTCSFSGSASIAYGANGAFNYLNATNNIVCNNATFGDPIQGAAKNCYFQLIQVADSDNDGVNDDIDQCSNTPAGTEVNAVGCAVLVTENVLIEAEDYDNFADSDAGNTGGAYRSDDVDIEATTDTNGGYNVGWTAAGEWLEYNVTLGAGTYDVSTRVASDTGGGSYSLALDGNSFGDDSVASTGGWQAFVTHAVAQVTVTEGSHTLRVNVTAAGFNFNWIQFNLASTDVDDSDNDGVNDNLDLCPNTPAGSVVDAVGCPILTDSDNDGVSDDVDQCPNTPAGTSVDGVGCAVVLGDIVPLFNGSTALEQSISFDRGDALVTRFSDRGRDRHAKEDHFQIYDHYLSHYWTHRTAQFEFVDYVAKGGSTIEVTFITEWKLGAREFRAWYRGLGTVAEYHGNYFGGGAVVELDHGTYDHNFNRVSDAGEQYRYRVIIEDYRPLNWDPAGGSLPLQVGQRMELEVSQFLDAVPEGRDNYYGTTYLYIVGQGLVPWKTVGDFTNPSSEREDSYPIAEQGWLGGKTTLPYNYTNEPDNHFMQMATNLSNVNGQAFVLGRRVHHSSFIDGRHDELNGENGIFNAMVGKAGTHFVNSSCASCHVRNGRAAPPALGEALNKWVFKVGNSVGAPDPLIGRVLQPNNVGINNATDGEGTVSIASWTESNGLRSPNYQFSKGTPAQFSARIAPQLVGLGLLEAIPEATILGMEDINDSNGDGISGKAQRSIDPVTGETRLGRFGWKAATFSVKHQVASAFNTDMGVMTSVLPFPDCGSSQVLCGSSGAEISDENLEELVKYISLLGVRAQRGLDDGNVQQGQTLFSSIGCAGCHTETMQTSQFHPMSELRNQTIHPYTDLLVHDMGAGLADNLAEGQVSGAEWRTTPLWGLGLSACVTGGVANDIGGQGNEYCTPEHSYLHDGRARSIEEAILWHGGESENSKNNYQNLSASQKNALQSFLKSL